MDQHELNNSLLDSFAMAVLTGLLASTPPKGDGSISTLTTRYAAIAYKFADAMIEERQKWSK